MIVTQTHLCPCCGYDLQGEIARWEEACPLQGRCVECGTEFDWELIYFSHRYGLPWLVEHAQERWDFARRWLPTWWRVLLPPWFWRDLRVTHPVSVRRAVWWVVLPCLVLQLLASVAGLAMVVVKPVGQLTIGRIASAFFYPATNFDVEEINRLLGGYLYYTQAPHYPKLLMLFSAAWVFMLMFLPWTRKRAKLRWAHIARASVYAMSWVMLLPAFRLGRNAFLTLEALQAAPGTLGLRLFRGYSMRVESLLLVGNSPEGVGLVLLLWSLWWWRAACVTGWKLEQGNVVWFLVSVAALLTAAVLTLDPMTMMGWI